MTKFSDQTVPPLVAKRMLAFINRVRDAEALLEFAPKSSAQPEGKWIGETVAGRIISKRNSIPGRRLSSISQLNDIQGFGQDKFDELVAMFQVNPSEAFRLDMYDGVILENWKLEHSTKTIDGEEAFAQTAGVDCLLRDYVGNELKAICLSRFGNQQVAQLAPRALNGTYLERFEDAHMGSYAFALWFYRIDMDNWFSFETVRKKTESYLSSNPNHNDRLELCLFKGFNNTGILNQPLNSIDLPVVINYAEHTISIWSAQLND